MADIELVIKIPEEEYKAICKDYIAVHACPFLLGKAIQNGTPIPDNATVCDIEQIRAEIDQKQYDFMSDGDYNEGIRFGLMLAYQIIDKYRAESEDKE